MIALFWLFLAVSVSPFKSKNRLAAENAALRHQLIVLRRRVRGRVQLTNGDRLFLVQLYRWFPSVLRAITIPASRSTWSSDVDRRPRGGVPSCVATRPTSPPWTYSLFQPLALICSTAWSSSGWRAETLFGSTPPVIRLRNGSHVRSRRRSLGIRLRAT